MASPGQWRRTGSRESVLARCILGSRCSQVSSFSYLCRHFLSAFGGRRPRQGESLISGPTQNQRRRWETPGVLTPSPRLLPCGVPVFDPVLSGSLWNLRVLPSCSQIPGPGDSLSPWPPGGAPRPSEPQLRGAGLTQHTGLVGLGRAGLFAPHGFPWELQDNALKER